MRNNLKHLVIDLALGVSIIGGLLWLLFATFARGAPAPTPRPVVVRTVERLAWADLAGHHEMLWCGGKWDTLLNPNGTYSCVAGSSTWVGNWWIDFEGRLSVTETLLDEDGVPGSPCSWAIKWDKVGGKINPAKLTGTIVNENGDGGKFGLTRMKKGK